MHLSLLSEPVNGGYTPFRGRKLLLFDDTFSDQKVGCTKHYMLGLFIVTVECQCLASSCTRQIEGFVKDSYVISQSVEIRHTCPGRDCVSPSCCLP